MEQYQFVIQQIFLSHFSGEMGPKLIRVGLREVGRSGTGNEGKRNLGN